MKKRMLSVFMCLCMVLTMVPAAFAADDTTDAETSSAAANTSEIGTNPNSLPEGETKPLSTEGNVFQVGDSSYASLSEAIQAAGTENPADILVIGNFKPESNDVTALSSLKSNIVVEAGGTVDLSDTTAYGSLLNQAPNVSITVKADGSLKLPGYLTEWFGGSSARMYIEAGSITISDIDKLTTSGQSCKWTLSEDAVVTVPKSKTMNLQFTASNNKLYGVDLIIPDGASLTVNGTMKGVSGQRGSQIELGGTLTVNGTMSVAMKSVAEIKETGILAVNGTLDVTKNDSSNNITLAQGGTFMAVSDANIGTATEYLKAANGSTLKSYTDAEGNTFTGAVNSSESSSNPEAAIGGTFYDSLDGESGALAAAESGDAVVLLANAEVNETTGNTINAGVTLSVPQNKTLTVTSTAASMLNSQGKLVVAAGGKVSLPTSGSENANWIGGDSDRLNLTEGIITYDFSKNMLTLAGQANVPDNQASYLHLNSKAINATIAKGAELTVNGTLKAVSGTGDTGTQLTVDGKLVVAESGMLTIANKASVVVNGTLELPLLSEEDITGTGDGTGLLGDIVINGNAAVKYGTFQVTGSNALLTLGTGAKATLNLAEASLALNSGEATVNGDDDGNMYSMLLLKDNAGYLPLNVVIDAGATAEVASEKTLKIVANSSMTINGTLDVKGILTIAQGVTEFAVNNGGTLKLPLMRKEAMTGTEDGTGLRGDISVASGAAISYADAPILGGEGAYLTLSDDGTAVVNIAKSSLMLTAGAATVNGDERGNLKAFLVAEADSGMEIVPLQIETTADTTVNIPSGKTLSIPNSGKLAIGGVLNVSGALEIHSAAVLSGNVTVRGIVAVYGNSTDAEFNLAVSGAKVLANGDIANQISSAANTKTPSSLSYTSIVGSVGTTTFTNGWEYYKSSSSGGGGSGGGSSTSFAVTVDKTTGGAVEVSPTHADKGDIVTITVKPDSGFVLDKLIATDKNGSEIKLTDKGDGKYTFNMPASKVTVKAAFTQAGTQPEDLPFTDVSKGAYYYDAVVWAVEKNITSGTSATTFSPNASCTRAQMVTFLWRAAGSPKTAGSNPFTDVNSGAYYYDAVLWAVEQGITSGTSATTFAPDAIVTRGQTVTFLYRSNGSPAVSGSGFADVAADAYYASAVAWAVSESITNGTSATTFSPNNACTRAQIVTFLYRDAQ